MEPDSVSLRTEALLRELIGQQAVRICVLTAQLEAALKSQAEPTRDEMKNLANVLSRPLKEAKG